jgi:hypothetical protein
MRISKIFFIKRGQKLNIRRKDYKTVLGRREKGEK